ncbi:unnamed protein product [Tilletia controversa]|nr:unnamed protein product [Tilletia controversa]
MAQAGAAYSEFDYSQHSHDYSQAGGADPAAPQSEAGGSAGGAHQQQQQQPDNTYSDYQREYLQQHQGYTHAQYAAAQQHGGYDMHAAAYGHHPQHPQQHEYAASQYGGDGGGPGSGGPGAADGYSVYSGHGGWGYDQQQQQQQQQHQLQQQQHQPYQQQQHAQLQHQHSMYGSGYGAAQGGGGGGPQGGGQAARVGLQDTDIEREETLEQLQDNKLALVCAKLALKPSDTVTGVTLAKEQAAFGNERIKKAGVDPSKARIFCLDYRDICSAATFHFTRDLLSRLLWQPFQLSTCRPYELYRRPSRALSREEYQLVKYHNSDMRKLPLFLAIVLILEELFPLVLIYAPGLLPSTCILPSQIAKVREKDEVRRTEAVQRLRAKEDGLVVGQGTEAGAGGWDEEAKRVIGALDAAALKDLSVRFRLPTWGGSMLQRGRLASHAHLVYLRSDDALMAGSDSGSGTAVADEVPQDVEGLQRACTECRLRTSGVDSLTMSEGAFFFLPPAFGFRPVAQYVTA